MRERVHDARADEKHADRRLGRAELRWKKYAKSALPWKPPAKLSSAKRKDIFARIARLCGLTSARSADVGDSACATAE